MFNQRQVLLEQLKSETDPAVALHLSSVILIHTYTQNIVHIPGKCVPLLIEFLKSHMEADKYDLLHNQQGIYNSFYFVACYCGYIYFHGYQFSWIKENLYVSGYLISWFLRGLHTSL